MPIVTPMSSTAPTMAVIVRTSPWVSTNTTASVATMLTVWPLG